MLVKEALHAIIFDKTTARYELVEISDNGDETSIKRFNKIDFGVNDGIYLHELFHL